MAIAGRVAIVPKGDWSANATYKRLDAVTYNNTLYFAKKDVPAGTVTSNTEYWSKSIVGGVGAIATTEVAGIVKPDGKSMSVDDSGTLSINLDGTTITLDEAKNVIKLADTLKDKINGAFPAANLINNLTTTEAGFGLDARQGKALDDKIAEINGSLNNMCFTAISLSNRGINVKENYSIMYISKLLKIGVISIDITEIPIVAYDYTEVLNISGLFVLNDVTPMISHFVDGQMLQIIVDKANNVIKVYGDQTCTISRIRTQIVFMLA